MLGRMSGTPEIFYRVSPRDVVVEVGGPWDTFALENSGDDAIAANILGTSLWSNISGDIAKMFTQSALDYARVSNEPVELDYFCDSPTEIRHARMKLTAEPDGSVLLEHRFLSATPGSRRRNAARGRRWTPPLKRCILCKHVQVDGDWVPADSLAPGQEKNLFHTYCNDCRQESQILSGLSSSAHPGS